VVQGDPPGADAIASAIVTTLSRPPARHPLDLDGVAATRTILEQRRLATKVR
jgi:predicted glycosyltransferase